MAARMMGFALFVVLLTFSGFCSCSVPRELLANSTRNDTDAYIASEEASFFLGNDTTATTPPIPTTPGTTWCVAKNNVDDTTLQVALDYACGLGGAECANLQQGGVCFEPNNVQSHASYAFNSYYMKNGMLSGTCDFGGSAAPTELNPSHGSCIFETGTPTSILNGTIPGSGGSSTGVASMSNMLKGPAVFMIPLIFIILSLVGVIFGDRI
ncbi:hypothetical protein SUGI_0766870 [Cryptomeria japonica]|uniref:PLASMODESMATA CALLOSE-BINDING PROTEIN 5 n=1 Tax=Cryptomeria japonica TaxID=3369 RepID=UPI002414A153|nr:PLASMODESMATA CALLOSE-BINDING PROTEIN 5 [Cryptomeria japonica]GLJ37743.1 hypothetical protein SUGI_0766870 [Cryptomeria japonica]